MQTGDTDFDLRNRIRLDNNETIYFGQYDKLDEQDNPTATSPIIVSKVKGQWSALSVASDALPDAEFMLVATGPARHEIWTVLDNQLGKPARIVLLAHSVDDGQTWTLTSVAKPHDTGSFESFAMDKSGRGRLTIYLTRRQSSGHPGFYHLRTTDAGKTFSAPDYEPDALKSADEVDPDEDLEPLEDLPSVKTTAAAHPSHRHRPCVSARMSSSNVRMTSSLATSPLSIPFAPYSPTPLGPMAGKQ